MREYNEYIIATKDRLRRMHDFEAQLGFLSEAVREKEAALAGESVAISRYGNQPGGGSGELNAVEMSADRRIQMDREVAQLQAEYECLRRNVRRFERALDFLDEDSRGLLLSHYADGTPWALIGDERGYSEIWARKKGRETLVRLTNNIFGVRSEARFAFVV